MQRERIGSKKTCKHCGKEFVKTSPNEKYCSDCKEEVRKEQVRVRMRKYYYKKNYGEDV